MKDILTEGQLLLLHEAAGRPDDFVLVDARAEPRAALVHRRAWAGYRFEDLAWSGGASEVLRHGLPVVVIRPPGAPHPIVGELFDRTDDVCALVRHADGRLTLGGEPRVPDPGGETGAPAALLVRADGEERIDAVRLPVDLPLELEAGGTHRIALTLEHAGAGGPGTEWFEIDAPARTTLRVDVVARPGGDGWLPSVRPGRLARAAAPSEQGAPGPSRLAVILDRTCPDESGWSEARALALSGRAGAGYRDVNRGVRSGLERALRDALAGRDLVIDALAFGDLPGDGLGGIDGVELPSTAVQALGSGGAEAAAAFARATYVPGLDIWDPVEEALQAALDALGDDRSRTGAVLIVGCSPPRQLSAGGAFAALARSAGCWTAMRRYNALWQAELARARELGVRVACTFLTHGVCAPDERGDHERFLERQQLVRTGLAADMPVLEAPATADGVRAAVHAALELLARPVPRPAGVRVARQRVGA